MIKALANRVVLLFIPYFFVVGCQTKSNALFVRLSSADSGIDFENRIEESPEVNIMNYEYTYNGGGIAAADFNNDGLCDLYFTGNTVSNRLYLNQGDLKFKDITDEAGVGGRKFWKTGVTAADVNNDGWMDIYVCYSGPELNQSLSNQLFINNGIGDNGEITFTEQAEQYGLDAQGTYSTQAAFFDYDKDGDIDMFLINHGNHFYSPFINTNQLRNTRHPEFGNRLYRNETFTQQDSMKPGNHFTEVSSEAGIHGGGINFGLGVSISDVNNDGWPDIFVTNDYEEQDFLYLNNQDGTFSEVTKKSFGHLSRNGMGTDIADFNNDGNPDLIEVDMWPEDNYRQKLLRGPDDYNRYFLMVDSGFHYQQMRNTLQLNAGVGPDGFPVFCEIGQLAGVSATDWSWAPLFVDVDNDGFKDLFVTNGYLRDFTSMDFLKYTVEEARQKAKDQGEELKLYELVSKMPSTKTSDYLFRNNGNLTFSDYSREWGIDVPNLSFGATYADLDNDGDLELITNNTNETATVWLNQGREISGRNYLRVKLKGSNVNPFGIGSKVFVKTSAMNQMQEQYLTRGYQSSVDPILHFGLDNIEKIEKVVVVWPDGRQSIIKDTHSNQLLEINYSTASDELKVEDVYIRKIFKDVSAESKIDFVHHENKFIDFDREPLIPYQHSRQGPPLATGDVNDDGVDDFYVGGAHGQSGQLFIGDGLGHFRLANSQPWKEDLESEDTGATFFDADGDGDLDLFVVSGGNEHEQGSPLLDDRLYINNGKGLFSKAPAGTTVADHANGRCVVAADYDKDGDIDLFVGGHSVPGRFPLTSPGAILENESTHTIKFTVATNEVNPDLREAGMVTDALWTDFNGDTWPDLIIVGEWMPVRMFENQMGKLVEVNSSSLERTNGLWNSITPFDYDGDGDIDYVLGNAGSNLPWKISANEPLVMYYSDINDDGSIDPIMCYSSNGKEYPVASRDELLLQVSQLRKRFTTYAQYANATSEEIFGKDDLKKMAALKVHTVQSSVLENIGEGNFIFKDLPVQAQVSCVNGVITEDFNQDGFADILLAGNFYSYRTEYGRSDSSIGLLLLGDGKGNFEPVTYDRSGFYAHGDIRQMKLMKGKQGKRFILLARNNDKMSLIEVMDFNQENL